MSPWSASFSGASSSSSRRSSSSLLEDEHTVNVGNRIVSIQKLALQDYMSFPRALAGMLSARKVISQITEVIRSQLI